MDKRPKDKGEESAHVIAERYEIRDVIGSGGSGAVYRAWDTQLQRFVAVKRWHAPAMKSAETEGIERLWREAMTLAAVQHPNILTIHDFGVDDEGPYVVMEFLSGESLAVRISATPGGTARSRLALSHRRTAFVQRSSPDTAVSLRPFSVMVSAVAPNVFVTDGAFMTSANCVNPSLTYMAMTARAADYAVSELKKGNL